MASNATTAKASHIDLCASNETLVQLASQEFSWDLGAGATELEARRCHAAECFQAGESHRTVADRFGVNLKAPSVANVRGIRGSTSSLSCGDSRQIVHQERGRPVMKCTVTLGRVLRCVSD